MKKGFLVHTRRNFLTGLALVLPLVITLAVIKWFFGTIASLTDLLLFFIPKTLTHAEGGKGAMYWYWSLAALFLAGALVAMLGVLTRYYIGKKLIAWLDTVMLRLPLLNKIYGTVKQVNAAFNTGGGSSFKTVVLVEFPREGTHSVGFITSEQHQEVQMKTRGDVVCVFVPTTPNPTSGFLILVPKDKVTRLDMSVADAIKYIISLGSVAPEYVGAPQESAKPLNI